MSFWDLLTRVVFALLVLGGSWLLGSWLAGLVNAALSRSGVEPRLRVAVARALPALMVTLGALAALAALGVDTRGALILLAVAGLAVALAARDLVADLIAGATLLSTRPYTQGDLVSVGGVEGRVKGVGLLHTTLEGADGALILVRSQVLWQGPLVNRSRGTPRVASPDPGHEERPTQG